MWFTEAEAKAQEGKWVRVRGDSLWSERIDQGMRGKVVGAQPYQPAENGTEEESWGICIEMYLSRDQSLSVLLHHISKAQYASLFEEIPAERSLRTARIPPCAHSLQRHWHPARREHLTVVSSRDSRGRT
jgi:hypothetical protein